MSLNAHLSFFFHVLTLTLAFVFFSHWTPCTFNLQRVVAQKNRSGPVKQTLDVSSVLLVTQVLLRSEYELTQHLSWERDGILCFAF